MVHSDGEQNFDSQDSGNIAVNTLNFRQSNRESVRLVWRVWNVGLSTSLEYKPVFWLSDTLTIYSFTRRRNYYQMPWLSRKSVVNSWHQNWQAI